MDNTSSSHSDDLACLQPPPQRRYVRSFLFSRRIDAPFARVHLLARVLLVLCLSGATLRTINAAQPDLFGAILLSGAALLLFLLSGISPRMARFYLLLLLPSLFALFLSWTIFNPVQGHVTLLRFPLYSGHMTIGLAPWQAIFCVMIGGYFLLTRKLFAGVLAACIVSFVLMRWLPLPEWDFTQIALFHSLTIVVSDVGLLVAVTKVTGYAGMVLGTIALVITARDAELIGALRQLHVPEVIIFFLSTVFRSLDMALSDYETIRQAQLARAIAARPRSFLRRLFDLASVAVPMVAMMIRRSSEIGDALQARGYTIGRPSRNFYESSPWRWIDWIVVIVSIGLLYLALGPHVSWPPIWPPQGGPLHFFTSQVDNITGNVVTSLVGVRLHFFTGIFALSIRNLWWRYPSYTDTPHPWVLRDIHLEVEQGECIGITGASGAGKTTLCRTILGILPYSARLSADQLPQHLRGNIKIWGEPVTAKTAATQEVGMVLQDPDNQFLRMSVLHELAFGLQLQGIPYDEILRRCHEALIWVGLEHLWKGAAYLHPSDLSGGQKQRIAIAAFLALRPRMLLLDEPTSDLDPTGKREVIETIARLRTEQHMTSLLVEQDADILSTFCDRIALMDEGRMKLIAPPAEFYAQREVLEQSGASVGELTRIAWGTGYMFESRPPLTLEEAEIAFSSALDGDSVGAQFIAPTPYIAPTPSPRLVVGLEGAMNCAHTAATMPTSPVVPVVPIATSEDVWYTYEDGTLALRGVDLAVYRGEMVALVGPNGSGKTTFAKMLTGIYASSRGRIEVFGQNLASRRVRARLPRSAGYVFQNPDSQLFRRTVRDEIDYGLCNLGMDVATRKQRIDETLEAVHLRSDADEDPLFLSKGQRQRLAVAAIVAMGPNILIVDEPTTGQDYRSVTDMMRLLLDLQQQGKTIVLITHDMGLVAEYCQRAITFLDGKVLFTGTPAELFTNEAILHTAGLRPPVAAALSLHMRRQRPEFPLLLTADQWIRYLSHSVS